MNTDPLHILKFYERLDIQAKNCSQTIDEKFILIFFYRKKLEICKFEDLEASKIEQSRFSLLCFRNGGENILRLEVD